MAGRCRDKEQDMDWIGKSFHKENLDGTLEALRNIV